MTTSSSPFGDTLPLRLSRNETKMLRRNAQKLVSNSIREACAVAPQPDWQNYLLHKKIKHLQVFKRCQHQNQSQMATRRCRNLLARARSTPNSLTPPIEPLAASSAGGNNAAPLDFMARGSFPGSLREVLYGLLAVDDRAMQLQQEALYGNSTKRMQQQRLCHLELPTKRNPLKYVGVKWIKHQRLPQMMMKPRDYVVLECIGTMKRRRRVWSRVERPLLVPRHYVDKENNEPEDPEELWEPSPVQHDGDKEEEKEDRNEDTEDEAEISEDADEVEEVGYHLIHSVRLADCPELESSTRGTLSICYVYRQRNSRVPTQSTMVDVYVKCLINPRNGRRPGKVESLITSQMLVDLLVDAPQTLVVSRLKKINFFLRQPPPEPEPPLDDTSCAICLKKMFRKKTECTICRSGVCAKCRHWVRVVTFKHPIKFTSGHSGVQHEENAEDEHDDDNLDMDSENFEDERDQSEPTRCPTRKLVYVKKAFCATCVNCLNHVECVDAAIDDALDLQHEYGRSHAFNRSKPQFVTTSDQKRHHSQQCSLVLHEKLKLRDTMFSFDPYMQSYEDLSELVAYQKDVGPYVEFHLQTFKFDRKRSRLVAIRRVARRQRGSHRPNSGVNDKYHPVDKDLLWRETISERKPVPDSSVASPPSDALMARHSVFTTSNQLESPMTDRQWSSHPTTSRRELMARMCELQHLADETYCIAQETTRRCQELLRKSDLTNRPSFA